jgi:hypothetical protein
MPTAIEFGRFRILPDRCEVLAEDRPMELGERAFHRTIARWCADDGRVPRWAWLYCRTDRVQEKCHTIDQWAGEEWARQVADP